MRATRVNGFTLMELTVAMLISAIVVGITYSVYLIVIKSYHGFEARNQRVSTLIHFDHVLKRDFDKADIVLKDSAGVAMVKSGTTIKYAFYPEFILRESSKTDTFKLNTENVTAYFENIPLSELQADTELNRVDKFAFTIISAGDSIPCHYLKYYSSKNLIQRNPDAIH